jgi:hypothetical protein
MAAHSAEEVVLEAVWDEAAYFTCGVLAAVEGSAPAVALPPTQVGWYDVEDDFNDSQLKFERFLALKDVSRGDKGKGFRALCDPLCGAPSWAGLRSEP